MEGKLIKKGEELFELLTHGFLKGSTDHELIDSLNAEEGNVRYKLSLSNCQAIERGYDLDELVEGFIEKTGYHDFDSYSYKLGFQKALELMGDKKFTVEDVISMIEKSRETGLTAEYLILTKQQTEWNVVIEMEEPLTVKSRQIHGDFVASKLLENAVFPKPKLDQNGRIILKRK